MNASIGLVQLKLEKFNMKRHEIGKTWNKAFEKLKKNDFLKPMEITKGKKHHGLVFPLFVKQEI